MIQRVTEAAVTVDGVETGRIGRGLLAFIGVAGDDTAQDAAWLARKLPQIRVFDDEQGLMNLSVADIGGGILVISQFTLFGSLRKGTRPSYNRAAPPAVAVPLYEAFLLDLESALGQPVPRGVFGAHMTIHTVNDGPVTLILDTRNKEL